MARVIKPHKGVYKIPIKKDIEGYWCPNRLNHNGMSSTDLPNKPLVTDLTRVPKGSIQDVFKQRIEIALHTTPSLNLDDIWITRTYETDGSYHTESTPKPSLWQRIRGN